MSSRAVAATPGQTLDASTNAHPLRARLDLSSLDVGHNLSIVTSVCAQVPLGALLQRAKQYVPYTKEAANTLLTLSHFLDAGYGYRKTNGRTTRFSPSAGARYPTEILVLAFLEDGWRCCLYDFANTVFYQTDSQQSAESAAEFLRLEPGQVYVGAISVFWRTVQRYGLRGHRYCIIDAVSAISNLMELSRDAGGSPVYEAAGASGELSRLLGFSQSNPLVAGTRLGLGNLSVPVRRESAVRGLKLPAMREEVPTMSPVLKRVERFHMLSASQAHGVSFQPTSCTHGQRKAFEWLHNRHSMRGGGKRKISDQSEKSLLAYLRETVRTAVVGNGPDICLVYMSFSAIGVLTVISVMTETGDPYEILPAPGTSAAALSAQCFGNQEVISLTSSLVLLGVRDERALTDHGSYLNACHRVGHHTAEFYRIAVTLGLDSTAVGGFTWAKLANYVPVNNFYPLMAHAFGETSQDGGKDDVDFMLERPLHTDAQRGTRNNQFGAIE